MFNFVRLVLVISALGLTHTYADDETTSGIQEYRDLLADINPAELWI